MLIAVIQYLSGYLRIRIEGYSPERFLNLCSHYGIYLWNLKPCGHAYEMFISVRQFRKLRPIIRKTGTKVTIRERIGFPFFLHKYRKRKLFFVGIVFCIVSIYILSLFVWNIHIDGNGFRTDEVILEYLESKGVRHGMLKTNVDCERIVKDIRKEYDDIIWVSAYIKGTRLMIRVKENTDRTAAADAQDEDASGNPVDIVAEEDGVILSIITRKGVPQVHEGDTVQAGDVLVSGAVEVLNDAGEVTGYQYQKADAEIVAQTSREYEDHMPVRYEIRKKTGRKRYALWLETGKHVYRFGILRNSFTHTIEETVVKTPVLGEHFEMPFSLGISRVSEYEPAYADYTQKEYQDRLSRNFQKFCLNLEKKGVQILENNVKIYKETEQAFAKGSLTLAQPVGREQASDRKEVPDKDSGEIGQQEGN